MANFNKELQQNTLQDIIEACPNVDVDKVIDAVDYANNNSNLGAFTDRDPAGEGFLNDIVLMARGDESFAEKYQGMSAENILGRIGVERHDEAIVKKAENDVEHNRNDILIDVPFEDSNVEVEGFDNTHELPKEYIESINEAAETYRDYITDDNAEDIAFVNEFLKPEGILHNSVIEEYGVEKGQEFYKNTIDNVTSEENLSKTTLGGEDEKYNEMEDGYIFAKGVPEFKDSDTIDKNTDEGKGITQHIEKANFWHDKKGEFFEYRGHTFRAYCDLMEKYHVYKAGGSIGEKKITFTDVFEAGMRFPKTNIIETITIEGVKGIYDIISSIVETFRPNDIEKNQEDKSDNVEKEPVKDMGLKDVDGAFDNGYAADVDKDIIRAARGAKEGGNPDYGKFYGVDTSHSPDKRYSTDNMKVWSEGNPSTYTVTTDKGAQNINIPQMRMVELDKNFYQVSPFGRIEHSKIMNPNSVLQVGDKISSLDISNNKGLENLIEKYASNQNMSIEDVKNNMIEKCKGNFAGRIEKGMEAEASRLEVKISDEKLRIDGYNDKIAQLKVALEKFNSCDISKESNIQGVEKIKTSIEKFESAIEKVSYRMEKMAEYKDLLRDTLKISKDERSTIQDRFERAAYTEEKAVGRAECIESLDKDDFKKYIEALDAKPDVEQETQDIEKGNDNKDIQGPEDNNDRAEFLPDELKEDDVEQPKIDENKDVGDTDKKEVEVEKDTEKDYKFDIDKESKSEKSLDEFKDVNKETDNTDMPEDIDNLDIDADNTDNENNVDIQHENKYIDDELDDLDWDLDKIENEEKDTNIEQLELDNSAEIEKETDTHDIEQEPNDTEADNIDKESSEIINDTGKADKKADVGDDLSCVDTSEEQAKENDGERGDDTDIKGQSEIDDVEIETGDEIGDDIKDLEDRGMFEDNIIELDQVLGGLEEDLTFSKEDVDSFMSGYLNGDNMMSDVVEEFYNISFEEAMGSLVDSFIDRGMSENDIESLRDALEVISEAFNTSLGDTMTSFEDMMEGKGIEIEVINDVSQDIIEKSTILSEDLSTLSSDSATIDFGDEALKFDMDSGIYDINGNDIDVMADNDVANDFQNDILKDIERSIDSNFTSDTYNDLDNDFDHIEAARQESVDLHKHDLDTTDIKENMVETGTDMIDATESIEEGMEAVEGIEASTAALL